MYSYGVLFSGMVSDVYSVLQGLRWELKRGWGGRGFRGVIGMDTTTMEVWEMVTSWTKDDGRKEMSK